MKIGWIVSPICFGLAFFAAKYGVISYQNATPGLEDKVRTAFTDGAVKSCIEKQAADPANAALSHPVIKAYCQCFADGMADRVSNSDLKAISTLTNEQAIAKMQPVIEAAAEPCLAKAQ